MLRFAACDFPAKRAMREILPLLSGYIPNVHLFLIIFAEDAREFEFW